MKNARLLAVTSAVAISLTAALPSTARPASGSVPPSVVAIIENGGVNVLHRDFALAPGQRLVFPPGLPKRTWVSLPTSGSFEERVDAANSGTLGNLEADKLYWIKGTRLGIFVPEGSRVTNIFADRFHATGTVSSAIGTEHGTNPDALAIYVPDSSGWEWLADQDWIDAISTSYYTGFQSAAGARATCPEHQAMKKIAEAERLIFSASGNVEQLGVAHTPAGSPYTYQVGGVDDQGRTYLPSPSNTGQSVTPTRPYETGDRFEFPAADADSLDGSMAFGGTSGATPSTAGRALEVLKFARTLIGSRFTGVRDGALAIASKTAKLPLRGPLEDGRLERDELVALLHHVAIPAETPSPGRYLIEGYGALNDDAIALANRVLQGDAEEPTRPDEDALHERVESARPLLFPEARCG